MGRIFAIVLGVLFIVFIVFFGLRLREGKVPVFPGQSSGLNIDLQEIMPDEWLPYTDDQIKGLVRVNIDARWENDVLVDAEDEWLLFYLYDLSADRGTSQLGGVIYDAQNRPRGNDSIAIPDQSSAYLVPYRLLPDYHPPKTDGYLGDDSLDFELIAVEITGSAEDGSLTDRLLVRGHYRQKVNRFSMFWWIDEENGYGSAYASTPGWFSLNRLNPSDWVAWDEGVYIQELWSWQPMNDRSNLCHREYWHLSDDEYPKFVAQSDTDPTYAKYGGEVTFCNGQQPKEPAFPEAQVLAYLEDWNPDRIDPVTRTEIPRYSDVKVFDVKGPTELNGSIPPEVKVNVDFNSNEGWRNTIWTVRMIPPATIKDAVKWRIVAVEDR